MTIPFTLSPLWAIAPGNSERIADMYQRQLDFYANPPNVLADKKKGLIKNISSQIGVIDDMVLEPSNFTINNGVATLNIAGMIIPKSDFFSLFFGGFAALDILEKDFRTLIGREDVHTIVLDIDSPGGNAFGVQQLANLIFESRHLKTIIAVTSGMMTSAAMWIGAAAHKVFITGDITVAGSIGTVTTHTDISELNKKIGIKQEEVAAGDFKRITSSLEPLTEAGRAVLKDQVTHANSAFVRDIGKFRNARPSSVSRMAEGRTFIGTQGVKVGLIDGLMTMEKLIENATTKDNNFNTLLTGGKGMTLLEKIAEMKQSDVDLYNAVIAKGKLEAKEEFDKSLPDVQAVEHAKGVSAGVEEGKIEGMKTERARISSLTELSNATSKTMVDAFIADGKTTAPEAAVEILKAQTASNATNLTNLENASPDALDLDTNSQEGNDDSKKGMRQLVKEHMAANAGVTKGAAIIACTKQFPNATNDFAEVVTKSQ